MSHQCVRCNTFYEDGSREILQGCSKCKGRFFFYVKKDSIKQAEEMASNLTRQEVEEMEKDAIDIIGSEFEEDNPIVLNLENIKILKPGKFELDLVDLFRGRPLVYKLEDGKYFIDVPSTFKAKDLEFEKKGEIVNKKGEKGPLD
ncbi:MAG: Zn-ribbon containing protein [Nanoarchaeota archaeon]